jgi:FG-GAP-like repeat
MLLSSSFFGTPWRSRLRCTNAVGPRNRKFLMRDCALAVFGSALFTLGGTADFITAPIYPAGPYPGSVAAGDFNGDGILDFAAVGAAGGVSISLGNGDGTFQPVQKFGPRGFLGVAAGDFNHDGFSDLVVIDSYEPASPARSPTTVTILLNAADW